MIDKPASSWTVELISQDRRYGGHAPHRTTGPDADVDQSIVWRDQLQGYPTNQQITWMSDVVICPQEADAELERLMAERRSGGERLAGTPRPRWCRKCRVCALPQHLKPVDGGVVLITEISNRDRQS